MGRLGWLYDGVNSTVPRNAGPECAEYASIQRKLIETVILITISVFAMKWSYRNMRPIPIVQMAQNNNHHGKQILLAAMSLTFGMELGFKFASRSVIYILNPCHITTIIQIYLLAAKPSKAVTILFRMQMNYLNGPFLAFVFPETEARMVPMEAVNYWLQHGLMFIIPVYLLRIGGVYNMEEVSDWTWNTMSYGVSVIYHFIILNIFSLPSQVNLNHMLCPAILDPFQGPYYRICAVTHQAVLSPILCKLYCILCIKRPTAATNTKPAVPSTSTANSGVRKLSSQDNHVDAIKSPLTPHANGGSGRILENNQNHRKSDLKLNDSEKID